jgi:hypothetical protein
MSRTRAMSRIETANIRADSHRYNYVHFRTHDAIEELVRSLTTPIIRPGDFAPDFKLPKADSGAIRLSELKGTPVLLRFASIT